LIKHIKNLINHWSFLNDSKALWSFIKEALVLIVVFMFDCLMGFNATFNNISVISLWSVLLVEETGGPGENHQAVTSH
jgi:hypothetical protein